MFIENLYIIILSGKIIKSFIRIWGRENLVKRKRCGEYVIVTEIQV